MRRHAAFHDEVVAALKSIGDARRGEAIRRDRGSELQYLGIGFPALRARVKQGFSFSLRSEDEVLEIWDALWRTSPYGDVLFAAIEFVAPIVRRKNAPPGVWPVVRAWSERIDNWCHSDALSGIYSRLLAARFGEVYPAVEAWNASPGLWLRRLSLTSLIHYSGKGAVFLPPQQMLPLVANCTADHRQHVEMAVGWVLREVGQVYPDEVGAFLQNHAADMSSRAFARAVERRTPLQRAALLAMRKARLG
jgi:3-methyladenine DNA glycosylase AlkD